MAIADKLQNVNQCKQDIKAALKSYKVDMTNVTFSEYPEKINTFSEETIIYDHGILNSEYPYATYKPSSSTIVFNDSCIKITGDSSTTSVPQLGFTLKDSDIGKTFYVLMKPASYNSTPNTNYRFGVAYQDAALTSSAPGSAVAQASLLPYNQRTLIEPSIVALSTENKYVKIYIGPNQACEIYKIWLSKEQGFVDNDVEEEIPVVATAGGSLPSSPWTFGGNSGYRAYQNNYIYLKSTNTSGGDSIAYYEIQDIGGYSKFSYSITGHEETSGGLNSFAFLSLTNKCQVNARFRKTCIDIIDHAIGWNEVLYTHTITANTDHKVTLEVVNNMFKAYIDDVQVYGCSLSELGSYTGGSKVLFGCTNPYDACQFYVKEVVFRAGV